MLNVLNSTSVLNLLTQNTFKSSKFICMPHNTNNEDFGLLIRKSNIISIIFMCNPYYCGANMQRMYNILIYRFESWLLRFLQSVSHVSDKLCQSDFMIAPIIRCMIYDWESKATSCMFLRKKAIHRWMICGSVYVQHILCIQMNSRQWLCKQSNGVYRKKIYLKKKRTTRTKKSEKICTIYRMKIKSHSVRKRKRKNYSTSFLSALIFIVVYFIVFYGCSFIARTINNLWFWLCHKIHTNIDWVNVKSMTKEETRGRKRKTETQTFRIFFIEHFQIEIKWENINEVIIIFDCGDP